MLKGEDIMKQVKRVTKKEFESEVEDKITEGYKLKSKTDRQAILSKPSLGSPLGHIVVFILFGWWTFFIANLGYAAYCYAIHSDEVQLKIERK